MLNKHKYFTRIAAPIAAIAGLFAALTLNAGPAAAWWISTHNDLADDALQGLGLSSSDINAIAGYAEDPDLELPDPGSSCHRTGEYQLVYAQYGGDPCAHPGAEWWARDFVASARSGYLGGNSAQWRHDLGFALHYIEDSACPAHVFPFKYAIFSSPHWNFESDVASGYGSKSSWRNAAQTATVKLILHGRHLAQAVEAEADCVNTLACSYVREDGASIGDPPPPRDDGYLMSDGTIEVAMKRAASVIKGAAAYSRTSDAALPPVALAVDAPDGFEYWRAGSTQTIRWAYCGNPGDYVKIDLLKDGIHCLAIADNASLSDGSGEGVGSCNWTIPYTLIAGSGYTVRLTSTANPTVSDASDNPFTITPPLNVQTGVYGFVGVGIDPPLKIFHVSGTGAGTVPLFQRGTDSAGFIIERTSANRWVFGVNEGPPQQFVISTFPTGSGTSVPRLSISLSGDVNIPGTLSKGSGSFRIDHPLAPSDKYLLHSFVESPDMLNIYSGTVTLDGKGEATVELPAYFTALNRGFTYQLDAVGGFAPLYLKQEIKDNQFSIAGGKPGLKASWQVTGIRKDPFATAHPITADQDKPMGERGDYLHPPQ